MPSTTRLLAAVAAVLVAAGGIAHYVIWDDRYRDLPEQVPGVDVVKLGMPVNVALSIAAAVLLVLLPRQRLVAAGALLLQLGSIFALVDGREWQLLGWEERGYDPAARNVLIVEVLASVVLVTLLVVQSRRPSADDSVTALTASTTSA